MTLGIVSALGSAVPGGIRFFRTICRGLYRFVDRVIEQGLGFGFVGTALLIGPLPAAALQEVQILSSEQVAKEVPAPRPYALPPSVDNVITGEAPTVRALQVNHSLSDRLTRKGQVATFLLLPGENPLSLIECDLWGFARGVESKAVMRILDARGAKIDEVVMQGKTLHQGLLASLDHDMQEEGMWGRTLELEALEGTFRFVLIRHGSYRPVNNHWVRDLGTVRSAHGWLPADQERSHYTFQGRPGLSVIVTVEPTRERGREYHRRRLFRRPAVAAGILGDKEDTTEVHPLRKGEKPYPPFVVGLPDQTLAEASYSQVIVIPESGTVGFWVTRAHGREAGMFDLTLQRELEWRSVQVRVANRSDGPLANARVDFLLEPWMAHVGSCSIRPREGKEPGLGEVKLPVGAYSVVLSQPDQLKWKRIRLFSDQPKLHLIW